MTDQELLELAAKAAGYAGKRVTAYGVVIMEAGYDAEPLYWKPLTDDGAALRLAVKLGADIQPKGHGVEVWVFESRVSSGVVEYGDDPCAATRRAIVRAAAEIGRAMP